MGLPRMGVEGSVLMSWSKENGHARRGGEAGWRGIAVEGIS